MRFHVDQRFGPVTRDRFVEVYFSEAFNDAVAPISGMKERKLVEERTNPDGTVFRRVHLVPAIPMPAAFEKVLAGRIVEYDEVCTYDPRTQTARYVIEHKGGDRIRAEGIIRFVVDGAHVRRTIDGEVEIKVFALGAIAEKFIQGEPMKGYDKVAAFLQSYLSSA